MIDRASNYLKQKHDQPFFLMVSMFHVHTPVKTECQWLLDKYERSIPSDSPARKRRVTYAAFVETLDHYVGNLLTAIDAANLAEETLVVFLSDNGGHPEYATNAPLRGSKWNLYEGGIRVPFVMRWPGQIKPGTQSETPVIGYDLLPTFVKLAGGSANKVDGIDISAVFKNSDQDLDRSLIWHFPYYHPERGYKHAIDEIGIGDFAVSKTHPQSAIMQGDHKLLYFYEQPREELYDLSDDRGEQNSLTKSRPAVSNKLRDQLLQQLRDQDARFPTKKED
jgi:uncharacterized sulfatase